MAMKEGMVGLPVSVVLINLMLNTSELSCGRGLLLLLLLLWLLLGLDMFKRKLAS